MANPWSKHHVSCVVDTPSTILTLHGQRAGGSAIGAALFNATPYIAEITQLAKSRRRADSGSSAPLVASGAAKILFQTNLDAYGSNAHAIATPAISTQKKPLRWPARSSGAANMWLLAMTYAASIDDFWPNLKSVADIKMDIEILNKLGFIGQPMQRAFGCKFEVTKFTAERLSIDVYRHHNFITGQIHYVVNDIELPGLAHVWQFLPAVYYEMVRLLGEKN